MSENKMIGEKELEKIVRELRLIAAMICLSACFLLLLLGLGFRLVTESLVPLIIGIIFSVIMAVWGTKLIFS